MVTQKTETPPSESLNERLSQDVLDKVKQLTGILEWPPDEAVIESSRRMEEIAIEGGYFERAMRGMFGGSPPTEKIHYYSKTIATVKSDESGSQNTELYGQWKNGKITELSLVGIQNDWSLNIQFGEKGEILEVNLKNKDGPRTLDVDDIEDLFSKDVNFSLNERFMETKLDEKLVNDFKDQGGSSEKILESDVPEAAPKIRIHKVGPGGISQDTTHAATFRKITRPDGVVVYVETATASGSLPTERDAITAALRYQRVDTENDIPVPETPVSEIAEETP